MKKLKRTILVLFILIANHTFAQTTLSVGDIAFIGLNSDGDDEFSMLLLKDITAGTSFYITDKGWNDASGFFTTSGDGIWQWSTTTTLSAGEIINIKTTDNGVISLANLVATPGTVSWVENNGTSISYMGDHVFIYQGTHASPTFIAGVHWNVESGSTNANWDGSATSAKTSALPDQLTNGVNAIWLYASGLSEKDNFMYNCSTTTGSADNLRAAVTNIANWDVDLTNTTPYTINPFPCSFTVSTVSAPTVTTTAASSISTTSATLGGEVTSDGGATVSERGIVYSTSDATPTIAEGATKDINGSGTGTFSESIGSLSANTTYYYNAYAINSEGTSYGTASSFTTDPELATVTTQAVSDITQTTATGNGNITDLGTPNPTAHGVCWNTGGTPTTSDSKTDEGAASSTGAFTSSITSLSANTTYYVRAYATNSAGTSYGTASSFTTLMSPPGNALNFDGVDSNVTTTNILTIGSSSHTLEVWVKIPLVGTGNLDSGERVGVIFGNYDAVNSGVINYEIHDDGQVRWYIGGASQYGTQDLRDNEWHHLAFIRDKTANKLSIYIDGILELESASAEADQVFSKAQIIGMDQRSLGLADTPFFHGEMDELRIWNDVRTLTEIRANMKVALIGDEADLVTYYKFDHSAGSSLDDLTSNTNDGTLQNMVDADWVSSESMLYIPTAIDETDLAATSFTANWEQNYTAAKYYLDVSTASDFSTFVTNYENKEIIGQTTVSQSVTGLTSGVNYYYRLRAYNENTLLTSSNSNTISLRALVEPTVTTQAVSSIATTTATGNGNITDLGAPNPTAYGVCWNTGGTPTTADDKTDEGAASSIGTFTSSLSSLSPNTTYYVRAYATNSEGTSYGAEVSFTTDYSSTTWTGAASSEWNVAGNWTNGVPTSSYNVTIPVVATIYPLTPASLLVSANNLEIDAGALLEVSGAGNLQASGEVVVQSDATNSASLIGNIQDGSGIDKVITYNRYVTGGQWHLIGAPFEGQDIGDLIDAVANDISSMKDYDAGDDIWNLDFTGATVGTMTSGKGYAIKRATDGIISISGTFPTNPNVTLDKLGNGWNLLGNPYASAVYATDPGGFGLDYLLNASNVGSMETGFEALYVWEEDLGDPTNSNNYKSVNNAGSGDLYKLSPQVTHLQTGQGFFVKASVTATTFNFSTSMQDHQSTLSFYKEEAALWPTISIQAEISTAKASTTITYNSMMTRGMDKTYDAGLLNSYPEFALYSRLVEDYEGMDFMLQALPEDYDNLVVPIGLDAKAGEIVTFSARTLNIPEAYAVVIEDRAMNTFTDLSDEAEYAVQLSDDSDGTGRFYLRTSFKSALGFGDLEEQADYQVFTSVKDHQLVIRGEITANTTARIYSITGKRIATINLEQATEQSVSFNEERGVYIFQISNEQGTYTQKFSWMK